MRSPRSGRGSRTACAADHQPTGANSSGTCGAGTSSWGPGSTGRTHGSGDPPGCGVEAEALTSLQGKSWSRKQPALTGSTDSCAAIEPGGSDRPPEPAAAPRRRPPKPVNRASMKPRSPHCRPPNGWLGSGNRELVGGGESALLPPALITAWDTGSSRPHTDWDRSACGLRHAAGGWRAGSVLADRAGSGRSIHRQSADERRRTKDGRSQAVRSPPGRRALAFSLLRAFLVSFRRDVGPG